MKSRLRAGCPKWMPQTRARTTRIMYRWNRTERTSRAKIKDVGQETFKFGRLLSFCPWAARETNRKSRRSVELQFKAASEYAVFVRRRPMDEKNVAQSMRIMCTGTPECLATMAAYAHRHARRTADGTQYNNGVFIARAENCVCKQCLIKWFSSVNAVLATQWIVAYEHWGHYINIEYVPAFTTVPSGRVRRFVKWLCFIAKLYVHAFINQGIVVHSPVWDMLFNLLYIIYIHTSDAGSTICDTPLECVMQYYTNR